MKLVVGIACGLLAATLVGGCSGGRGHTASDPVVISAIPGDEPVKVTATIGMIADVVGRIGGDYVQVTNLMGPGVDPHLYKANEKDIRALASADVIFYNGLHLEGKMTEVLERMSRRTPAVPVTEEIDESVLRQPPGIKGGFDPHVWFDVELWSQAADKVQEVLTKLKPDRADVFESNAAKLHEEFEELDRYAAERIAAIPQRQRVLITAHDAFGYFGDAYDIEVRGVQGLSTESEASVKDINGLVDLITERGVKAVFIESTVGEKNIEALVEGCRARSHNISIGGKLYSDALGPGDTPEGTYTGMVRYNVDTIVQALR